MFGSGPSVAAALWAWVLWLPDLLLPHDEGHSGGDVVELVLMAAEPAASVERHCTVVGTPGRLPGPVEVAVFRIVQEALRNAERHARARRVDVQLELSPAG